MTDVSKPTDPQASPDPGARRAAVSGALDGLTIAAGYLPIAFSFGVVAVQSGFDPIQAVLVSILVFAGASQFMLVGLVAAGAAPSAVVIAVVLANVRHLFYGPSLLSVPHGPFAKRKALLIAFGLTDEVFASAIGKAHKIGAPGWIYWLFAMETVAYLSWVAGTGLGSFAGIGVDNLPPVIANAMSFVLPALFIALAFEIYRPGLKGTLIATAAITLGGALVLPGSIAVLVGMLGGAAVSLIGKKP